MAIRQYIGARYVPRFLGTYDPTQQYEALDVVDNGLGTSYIARDNVPAGTPLTDATHWFIYGASSGAIVSLQNRMDTAENDIDDLENNVDDLFDIAVRDKKKFLLIGDSYGDNPRATLNWTNQIKSLYPDTRFKAVQGYGFMTYTPGSPDYSFLGLLKAFKNELTAAERAEITDIIVCGGWNDARQVTVNGKDPNTDLYNDIKDFADYANTYFVNAIPHVGFIAWQTSDCVQPETNINDLNRCCNIYENLRYKNIHVLDGVSSVMRNSRYMDISYFHPNNSGGSVLGMAILRAVFGGFRYTYKANIGAGDVTFNSNNSASGAISDSFITSDGDTVEMVLYISSLNVDTSSDHVLLTFDETALNWGHNVMWRGFGYDFAHKNVITAFVATNRTLLIYTPSGSENIVNGSLVLHLTLNSKYY